MQTTFRIPVTKLGQIGEASLSTSMLIALLFNGALIPTLTLNSILILLILTLTQILG